MRLCSVRAVCRRDSFPPSCCADGSPVTCHRLQAFAGVRSPKARDCCGRLGALPADSPQLLAPGKAMGGDAPAGSALSSSLAAAAVPDGGSAAGFRGLGGGALPVAGALPESAGGITTYTAWVVVPPLGLRLCSTGAIR